MVEEIVNNFLWEKRKLGYKVVDDVYSKYLGSVLDKKSLFSNNFICKNIKYENYQHDFAGHVGNVDNINIEMKYESHSLNFGLREGNDNDHYLKLINILVDQTKIYHYCQYEGSYFEEAHEDDEEPPEYIDTKLYTKTEIDALKTFFNSIQTIF